MIIIILPQRDAKYCDEFFCFCLSVCLSAGITRKSHSRTLLNFCACCLRLWLGPPCNKLCRLLPFYGWRPWWYHGTNGPESNNVMFRSSPGGGTCSWTDIRQLECLVEFVRMQHQLGRRLLLVAQMLSIGGRGNCSGEHYLAKLLHAMQTCSESTPTVEFWLPYRLIQELSLLV